MWYFYFMFIGVGLAVCYTQTSGSWATVAGLASMAAYLCAMAICVIKLIEHLLRRP